MTRCEEPGRNASFGSFRFSSTDVWTCGSVVLFAHSLVFLLFITCNCFVFQHYHSFRYRASLHLPALVFQELLICQKGGKPHIKWVGDESVDSFYFRTISSLANVFLADSCLPRWSLTSQVAHNFASVFLYNLFKMDCFFLFLIQLFRLYFFF